MSAGSELRGEARLLLNAERRAMHHHERGLRRFRRRANAVAMALDSGLRAPVAVEFGIDPATLRRWIADYRQRGVEGLFDNTWGRYPRRRALGAISALPAQKAVQPQTRLQTAAVARRAG